MNQTLQTRIICKHDTSANWAGAKTFVPLEGEFIVYDDLNKFKIGDGKTVVGELLFANEKWSNTNTVSMKGYYFTEINPNTKQIRLSMKQSTKHADLKADTEGMNLQWQVGDTVSIFNKQLYKKVGNITAIDNNLITIDNTSGAPSEAFNKQFVETESIEFCDWSCYAEYIDEATNAYVLREGQVELGQYSVVFGYKNNVHAPLSYALGKENYIAPSEGGNLAVGRWNTILGASSVALGYNNTVSANDAFAIGQVCEASGVASFAMGDHVVASGRGAHAEGGGNEVNGYTKAIGAYSHAEGSGTQSTGAASHSEGTLTKAIGESSHAEGYNTESQGGNSHTEGSGTKALKSNAHAEGYLTTASGQDSHAEGQSTIASGSRAHAQGMSCEAKGANSFAGGGNCKAFGNHSTALGYSSQTTEEGEASAAIGYAIISSGRRQVIVGSYNKNDDDDKRSFFAVGCGVNGVRRTGLRVRSTDVGGEVVVDVVNNKITNLADGVNDKDAVNMKQLKEMAGGNAPTKLSQLENDCGFVDENEVIHEIIPSVVPSSLSGFENDVDYQTKGQVEALISGATGNIESALDAIIAIQNSLIGGNA